MQTSEKSVSEQIFSEAEIATGILTRYVLRVPMEFQLKYYTQTLKTYCHKLQIYKIIFQDYLL
jgi:hypothetical protein